MQPKFKDEADSSVKDTVHNTTSIGRGIIP